MARLQISLRLPGGGGEAMAGERGGLAPKSPDHPLARLRAAEQRIRSGEAPLAQARHDMPCRRPGAMFRWWAIGFLVVAWLLATRGGFSWPPK